MAKRTKKSTSRSLLKLEALEQRQLLAGGFTEAQGQEFADIVHPNGNVYDQVLLKSSSITVTNDPGQITRVSFLDLSGDIVQAEFSGAGSLSISLDADTYQNNVAPENYNQSGVLYVQGLATFTIQGSDASTNFTVFSVGSTTAHAGADSPLFADGKDGGNNFADVARLTIVAEPSNPNGSVFGGIRAGNAIFSDDSGVVGITAANVHVQDVVRVGDIDAKGTATPALVFGENSQFGSVEIAGGDLVQTNGKSINNSGSYGYQITSIDNETSFGAELPAQNITAPTFTDKNPLEASSKTFELTAGIDAFAGAGGNDKFVGTTSTALSALDDLNGGEGADTLSLASTAAITIPASAKVSSIETAVVTSGASVDGDFSTWTGLTTLTVVSNTTGAEAVTAPATADVILSNNAVLAAAAGGEIDVNGGKTVNVTSTFSNTGANGTTSTGGVIDVNGTAATTSVTVTQTAPVTDNTKPMLANGAVTISGTDSALTTVSLTNYGDSTIDSKGLATLTLAGKGGTLSIDNNTTTTLALNTAAADVGAITVLDNKYATINVTTSGSGGSKIANIADTSTKTLNVTGSKALTLTSAAGMTALETVTVSDAAGIDADLSAASVKTVNASASTGSNTVTIDATKATYSGGSGTDTVTIAAAPSKAIAGGGGNDVLVVNAAGVGVLADNANVSGFEGLQLGANATGAYDVTGFTSLKQGAVAGNVTYDNVALGTPLTITATETDTTTYNAKAASGSSDTLPLTLSSSAAITGNTVTASNIETVAITNTDSNSTAHVNSLTLTAADAKTITVTGNAGLTLTATGSTKVTSFDASAVTGADSDVTYTSLNTTANAAVSIKGGAGDDNLDGTAQAIDTMEGGAGADDLQGNGNLDVLTGGAGNDTFRTALNSSGNIYATITDFSSGDSIDLSGVSAPANTPANTIANVTNLGAKITLAGTAAFADYLNAAASGHAAAGTNSVVSWFQYGGDTFIVVDNNNADVFTSGATTGDQVIRLSGLVELKDADIAGELFTL